MYSCLGLEAQDVFLALFLDFLLFVVAVLVDLDACMLSVRLKASLGGL